MTDTDPQTADAPEPDGIAPEEAPADAAMTDTAPRRRRPITVPTDLGPYSKPVVADGPEAASHWDGRLWRRVG